MSIRYNRSRLRRHEEPTVPANREKLLLPLLALWLLLLFPAIIHAQSPQAESYPWEQSSSTASLTAGYPPAHNRSTDPFARPVTRDWLYCWGLGCLGGLIAGMRSANKATGNESTLEKTVLGLISFGILPTLLIFTHRTMPLPEQTCIVLVFGYGWLIGRFLAPFLRVLPRMASGLIFLGSVIGIPWGMAWGEVIDRSPGWNGLGDFVFGPLLIHGIGVGVLFFITTILMLGIYGEAVTNDAFSFGRIGDHPDSNDR